LLDMVSKYIVSRLLIVNESVMVIKNFFNITYVRNTGAAFSIFSGNTFLVMIVSFIIIIGIILYISKNKPSNKMEKVAYSLILGGAIGNFIDRVIYGYVRDFIEIDIFGWDYPIFNLADVFVVVGVILLVIATWRGRNDRG
ncbi:MAG: signal peptidase II, partial [Bacilli bacterium]